MPIAIIGKTNRRIPHDRAELARAKRALEDAVQALYDINHDLLPDDVERASMARHYLRRILRWLEARMAYADP